MKSCLDNCVIGNGNKEGVVVKVIVYLVCLMLAGCSFFVKNNTILTCEKKLMKWQGILTLKAKSINQSKKLRIGYTYFNSGSIQIDVMGPFGVISSVNFLKKDELLWVESSEGARFLVKPESTINFLNEKLPIQLLLVVLNYFSPDRQKPILNQELSQSLLGWEIAQTDDCDISCDLCGLKVQNEFFYLEIQPVF